MRLLDGPLTPPEMASMYAARAERARRRGRVDPAAEAAARRWQTFHHADIPTEGDSTMPDTTTDPAITHAEILKSLAAELGELIGRNLTIDEDSDDGRVARARWRVADVAYVDDLDVQDRAMIDDAAYPLGETFHRRIPLIDILRAAIAAARLARGPGDELAQAAGDTLIMHEKGHDDTAWMYLRNEHERHARTTRRAAA